MTENAVVSDLGRLVGNCKGMVISHNYRPFRVGGAPGLSRHTESLLIPTPTTATCGRKRLSTTWLYLGAWVWYLPKLSKPPTIYCCYQLCIINP